MTICKVIFVSGNLMQVAKVVDEVLAEQGICSRPPVSVLFMSA